MVVPTASILMLILLAITIEFATGSAILFIPVFLFMVVVYVLASIYLFKALFEEKNGQ